MVNFGLFRPKIMQVYISENALRTMAIVVDKIKLTKVLS